MTLILTDDHKYFYDDRPIDGCTSILQEAGLISTYATEWYKIRGTALHLATEFYDRGTLDENSVDPQIKGYLNSWKKFREEMNYAPELIEEKFYNSALMVGMKIDRLPGPLDLKTGQQEPWHILQVALHWATVLPLLDHHMTLDPCDVYLDAEGGSPKVINYTASEMREAYKVYTSLLHFLRWKREKGIK
jgi:hypothetical protein